MEIYDLTKCEYSNRHGSYGGMAGDKDGIIFNNEFWIVKYLSHQNSLLPIYRSAMFLPLYLNLLEVISMRF